MQCWLMAGLLTALQQRLLGVSCARSGCLDPAASMSQALSDVTSDRAHLRVSLLTAVGLAVLSGLEAAAAACRRAAGGGGVRRGRGGWRWAAAGAGLGVGGGDLGGPAAHCVHRAAIRPPAGARRARLPLGAPVRERARGRRPGRLTGRPGPTTARAASCYGSPTRSRSAVASRHASQVCCVAEAWGPLCTRKVFGRSEQLTQARPRLRTMAIAPLLLRGDLAASLARRCRRPSSCRTQDGLSAVLTFPQAGETAGHAA